MSKIKKIFSPPKPPKVDSALAEAEKKRIDEEAVAARQASEEAFAMARNRQVYSTLLTGAMRANQPQRLARPTLLGFKDRGPSMG